MSKNNNFDIESKKGSLLGRSFLLSVLALLIILFLYTIKGFILSISIAAVFSALFYPLQSKLTKTFKGRRGLAASLVTILFLLLIILPMAGIGNQIANEAIDLYDSSEAYIATVKEKGEDGPLGWINKFSPRVQTIYQTDNWQETATNLAKSMGGTIARGLQSTSMGTMQAIISFFIMVFTMFYFLKDGPAILTRLKYLSPLSDEYENKLGKRFVSVSRATVRGSLLLAVIQGSIGGITLWAFGVKSVLLWTVVMIILSIIPMIGSWLVLYPAALIQIVMGNVWQGVAIILITAVIIANIDNLLRPKLVGKEAGMHDLLIFFSTLGGIAVFGVMGFIIGPVITALMLTFLELYVEEFGSHLPRVKKADSPSPTVKRGEDEPAK